MADIFISYKREDQEQKGRVIPIVQALEAEGFDVFYDVEIPPGATWESVLQSKINASKCVIVLWSEASVASDWVKEEAEIAKMAGKIIPVFLDPVNAPFGFGRIEGANLVGWNGDLENVEWKNLVRAVEARVGAGAGQKQPEVTKVAMPVSKPAKTASGGGNGGRYALIALLVAVLGIGGFFGYNAFMQGAGKGTGLGHDRNTETVDSDTAARQREKNAFLAAEKADTIEAWDEFIAKYPTSAYLKDAKDRRNELAEKARLAALDAETANTVCRDALQGKIAYDGRSNTSWSDANLERLCGGNETSAEPAACFEAIMEGRISYGGGTNWSPTNAVGLCAGSKSARRTIRCFSSHIDAGVSWREASAICQADPTATAPAETSNISVTEDCLSYTGPFDVRVSNNGQLAQLIDTGRNSTPLAARGSNAGEEMELALKVIQEYDLRQQCFVARPNAPLSYWKTASGTLPSGRISGEDCLSVNASGLEAKIRGGMWYVYNGNSSMLRFSTEDDAKNAIAIMQKFDAKQICYVGRPDPAMTYLKR